MSYEYDENNGLQPKPPKKNNNDLGSWIFIAVMFAVAWPVGLILLLSKLSEGGGRKMRQQARDAWQRTAAGSVLEEVVAAGGEACAGARLRGEEHRPQGHRDAELLRQGRQNHEDHRRGAGYSGRVFPGAAGGLL